MKQKLLAKLAPLGQGHVLAFWDELADDARAELAAQLEALDLELIARLFRQQGSEVDWASLAARAQAPPAVRLGDALSPTAVAAARERGQTALRRGAVGAILVAGGQGTRLGFKHPKGMYPVGPISKATLFEVLLAKVLAAARRYGAAVPLYLMTSPATHDETVAHLAANKHHGLPPGDVHIFCQGTMPAVDMATGKLLLAERGRLALSPDGHGGMLAALRRSGALDDMRRRGLEHLFYFQVDNPLAPVCDALLLGHHLAAGSQLTTLAVAKKFPEERVGNIVSIDGRVQIIEYSDLPQRDAERRAADGSLELWAGNTAIHLLAVSLLEELVGRPDCLPFHIARKVVPYVDAKGQLVEPTEPNALKFERFIFDLLPAARHALVIEQAAAEAFAPLKNGPGAATDSPEVVHAAIVDQARRWLQSVGARVDEDVAVEISPLFALDADELRTKIDGTLHVSTPRYFH